jgi:hypothetical protein
VCSRYSRPRDDLGDGHGEGTDKVNRNRRHSETGKRGRAATQLSHSPRESCTLAAHQAHGHLMKTWVWAIVSAGIIPALLFTFRWFLLTTDVLVGYGWKWKGTEFHPSFDIRNRSGSKTYVLGNIAYTKHRGKELLGFDNKSLWDRELKPGTISYLEGAPVPKVNSIAECSQVEVAVRLQNGRHIKAQGPGQLYKGIHKIAFALRQRIERASLPLAN